jgi:hypothetical protein
MNKHKHFTHLWKHLICTNFLAVETRGDTCRWRKYYQWSRTSYGGNFIHLGIHVLACSKYNHPSNFIYLLITVNNITTIGTHPQCVKHPMESTKMNEVWIEMNTTTTTQMVSFYTSYSINLHEMKMRMFSINQWQIICRWWRYGKLSVMPVILKPWRRSNLRFWSLTKVTITREHDSVSNDFWAHGFF